MPASLMSSLWDLPGPRQFIYRTGRNLLEGLNPVVLYPPGVDRYGIKHELLKSIERDFFLDVRVLDAGAEDMNGGSQDPFTMLCRMFPELRDYGAFERTIEAPCLPDVILVDNLGNCPKDIQVAWLRVLNRWRQASQATGVRRSLLLLIPADAAVRLSLPTSDVRLSYQVWAGIPTALEVRLLCRMKTEGSDFDSQWREYMLASLAGNDIGMCESLWDVITCPTADIIEALKCYAATQTWHVDTIESALTRWNPKPPGHEFGINPHETGFSLLSQGITMYTPEYGEEINSALLAALGWEHEIRHRIWRAQAALLMPMIDEVRRRICDHMTAQYGPDWAVINGEHNTSPLEWGKLKLFFENLPRQTQEKALWGPGIRQAWLIRNRISHYTPITYRDYCDFWNLSVSVRRNSNRRNGR